MRLFVALALLLAYPATALACRCVPNISPALAYRNADVVVRAKVLAVRASGGDITKDGASARITVAKAWKGDIAGDVEVSTRTTCAFPFEEGADYLLYLRKAPDGGAGFVTNKCFGNK